MKEPVLDLYALKTFVLGIELGSFALAAKRQNKSTSAVSAQLKKLEQQTNAVLVCKSGRSLLPTAQGEQLLQYARKMLALNDEALEMLNRLDLKGAVRLGFQEDFSANILTRSLSRFMKVNPDVQLETEVNKYRPLINSVLQGRLDVCVTWQGGEDSRYQEKIAETPMHWIASPDFPLQSFLEHQQPLPLVVVEPNCFFKQQAIRQLEAHGIRWQVVCQSQSLAGIWPAVASGIGVTVRTETGMPESLITIDESLPALDQIGIVIHRIKEIPDSLCENMIALVKEIFSGG
ncbi:HTH-type transcriptional regulator YofA [Vibrio aerogenes CECT 7868]|uniref:HTH-type transcriptional regulator YofA n=1 Tax=Vibrio aerogenes CECT 7868 TaxID=1216006 RepID=A0A1M5XAC5_9VIBR|nr:LysR substrate-binding domain-containing protein [Vibrio aerogenes]SHH96751.1 HTH-type transcriptional regulator YofA [Vibrio aerogenes CECT 7868]